LEVVPGRHPLEAAAVAEDFAQVRSMR